MTYHNVLIIYVYIFCTVPYHPPVGPDFAWMCCKRQCCINTDPGVVTKFRETLWAGDPLDTEVIKSMIHEARGEVLLQSDGKPSCIAFAVKAANVSNNFLYGGSSTTTSGKISEKSRSDVSVLAWFESLLPIADKMPDEDWYLLAASTKKMVYEWYIEDVTTSQQSSYHVSTSAFVSSGGSTMETKSSYVNIVSSPNVIVHSTQGYEE